MIEKLVRFEFNFLDKLLYKFDTVNKYTHKKEIHLTIDRLINTINILNDKETKLKYFTSLIITPFLKRAIGLSYGEGLRCVSYISFIRLHTYFPDTMEQLLWELPYIGYWGDLNNLYREVYKTSNNYFSQRLLETIINIWCETLQNEETLLNNLGFHNDLKNFSLLCKWIPRKKSALDKDTGVVNKIAKHYYPELYKKKRMKALARYRKLVSKINRCLDTTEIKMCAKNFSAINFKNVPKKCMEKNTRAWLDVGKTRRRRHEFSPDRNITRNNYLNRDLTSDHSLPRENLKHIKLLLHKLEHPDYNYYRDIVKNTGELDNLEL